LNTVFEEQVQHTNLSDLVVIHLESLAINANENYILNRLAILGCNQTQELLKLEKFLMSHSVIDLVKFFVPVCLRLPMCGRNCDGEFTVQRME